MGGQSLITRATKHWLKFWHYLVISFIVSCGNCWKSVKWIKWCDWKNVFEGDHHTKNIPLSWIVSDLKKDTPLLWLFLLYNLLNKSLTQRKEEKSRRKGGYLLCWDGRCICEVVIRHSLVCVRVISNLLCVSYKLL